VLGLDVGKKTPVLQFYFEHYYIWGYAIFSSVALIVAVLGGVVLLRRARSIGTVLLVAGALAVIGSRCLDDVGWLVLSAGSGTIDFLKHPERQAPLDAVRRGSDILHFFGVAILALSLPMLARMVSPNRQNQ
jgi:hypothetical protein